MTTSSTQKQELGERLRRMRISRHMTQQDMGDVLGVSRNAVSQYESGKGEPSLEIMFIYCDYFHVDMNELSGYPQPEIIPAGPSLTSEEMQMIEAYRRRDDLHRKIIRSLCFEAESYRTEIQEKNDALKKAKMLIEQSRNK